MTAPTSSPGPQQGNGPATNSTGGGAGPRYGGLIATRSNSPTLLCTEHPGCLHPAEWKLEVRRGRRRHWTGRAACPHHTPTRIIAA